MFHSCPFFNRIYIQQQECFGSFVRSSVVRHLIRGWTTGNEQILKPYLWWIEFCWKEQPYVTLWEIPYQVTFSCPRKASLNPLKALIMPAQQIKSGAGLSANLFISLWVLELNVLFYLILIFSGLKWQKNLFLQVNS